MKINALSKAIPRSVLGVSPKILLVMKLSLLIQLLFLVHVSAAVYSQEISLDYKNAKLETVLKEIEKQSGYVFLYDKMNLPSFKNVDISVQNKDLNTALSLCLEDQPLTYKVFGNTIVLRKKSENLIEISSNSQLSINGVVKNGNGTAIQGANIRIKRNSTTTTTDENGHFTLNNVLADDILIISFTGYVKQEIEVGSRSFFTIILTEDIRGLEEVVVIGYGTQERKDITSAIGSFKPTDENSRPVMGPDQMLQGRIPGVVVTAATGIPGSKNRVSIRGIGSLSGSNEPLYVLDGIPLVPSDGDLGNYGQSMNLLSELNPNDIESIDVLKDAASASIYGSRATNGVILITTKSGSKGKSQIAVNAYTGIQNMMRLDKLKMAGPDLYVEVMNEGIDNFNLQNGYVPEDSRFVKQIQNPYPNREATDWLGLLLRTAHSSNVNVAFSGGNEKSTYYISGGYTNQQGTFIDNVYKKYNAKVNLKNEVKPWLSLGVNSNFSYTNNNRIPSGYNIGTNLIPRALEQRTFDVPYKPDGSYYVGGTNDLLNHNPIQALNEENVYLKNYRLLANAFAEFKLTNKLNVRSSFGADIIHSQDYVYYKQKHPYGAGNGKLVDDRRLNSNIIVENTINYKDVVGDLSMDFLAGHSFQQINTSLIGVDGLGFPSPSFDVNVVAAEISNAFTNLYGTAMQSFFGRANFSLDNKYLLNLSLRTDGSSRFSPKKRYGYFPAVSAGWIVSEESFWNSPQTDLKLRASYGSTGNLEGVNAYAYQALTAGGYNYNNESGIAITSFGNEDLTWEKANQFNGGFDLGLLKGKLNFTADYFIKNTNNLLYSKPTYGTSGFTSLISNIGSMKNWGYELGINTNWQFGELQWRSDLNVAGIKNKLTSLIGDDPLLIGRTHVLKVGEEVGSFYIYKQTGIYQDDSEVPAGLYASGIRAGDVKYEDVNGDEKIDLNDRQIIGSANPKLTGGFNNTFSYKNFDLGIFMNFSYGNKVYETWTGGYRLANGAWPMLESQALSRWTGPGTSNTVPRAIWGNTVNSSSSYSTRFLHDGSYLRLRSVTLGYSLPKNILNKINVNKMRIYFQADNLLLMTSYPLLDPEVNISLSPSTMGEDFLLPPQPRSFNIGVNVSF